MQKRSLIICFVLFAFTTCCQLSWAESGQDGVQETAAKTPQEIFEPFGGIKWEDGLFQIVNKLKAFKGIESITLSLSGSDISLKNINNKNDLVKKLSELLDKYSPGYYKAGSIIMAESYTGANGKTRKRVLSPPVLVASPIIIAGVPFSLKVNFEYAPGLEVSNFDVVPIETRAGYAFPLVITKTTLSSFSKTLADSGKNVIQVVESKYRKYDPENNFLRADDGSKSLQGGLYDKDRRGIWVSINPVNATISYSSVVYSKQLAETYRKFLAERESKNNAGKADMGAGI